MNETASAPPAKSSRPARRSVYLWAAVGYLILGAALSEGAVWYHRRQLRGAFMQLGAGEFQNTPSLQAFLASPESGLHRFDAALYVFQPFGWVAMHRMQLTEEWLVSASRRAALAGSLGFAPGSKSANSILEEVYERLK